MDNNKTIIKIGIDCDNVLRDFSGKFYEIIKREYPDKIDEELESDFNFSNIDLPMEVKQSLWEKMFSRELFVESKLYEDSLSEYETLVNELSQNVNYEFKFYCVTRQLYDNSFMTFKWLGENKFKFNGIICSNQKYNEDIDFLIDDSPVEYDSWLKHRKETNFILFNRKYNKHLSPINSINKLSEAAYIIKETCDNSKEKTSVEW